MKVVLVNPPPREIRERHDIPKFPHLGLGYISAYLKSKKIDCSVIEAKFGRMSLKDVERFLRKQKSDVVGVTAMTHEIGQAHEVAQIAKTISPSVITVVGGAHATALPYQTLEEFPAFDALIFGEGEHTLIELINAVRKNRSLEGIKGVAYRDKDRIHVNEARELIRNIDALPFPAWELFPPSTSYPVMTSRGCVYRCNFCMRVSGGILRKRSVTNVIAELERDIDVFGAKVIEFTDETFGIDKRFTHQLLDLMMERGLHRKIKWTAESRVDLADLGLYRKMKAAGCKFLGFGVESGNEQILRNTRKGITLEKAMRGVALAKKAGLRTGSFFILGHPHETYETVQDTINFAVKLNTTRVAFGIMVPYPGTEIYEMAKKGEGGYKIISSDWYDFNKQIGNCLELETLNRKELEKLQLSAYLKFYLYNYRILDLAKLAIKERRTILTVLKKLKRRKR